MSIDALPQRVHRALMSLRGPIAAGAGRRVAAVARPSGSAAELCRDQPNGQAHALVPARMEVGRLWRRRSLEYAQSLWITLWMSAAVAVKRQRDVADCVGRRTRSRAFLSFKSAECRPRTGGTTVSAVSIAGRNCHAPQCWQLDAFHGMSVAPWPLPSGPGFGRT